MKNYTQRGDTLTLVAPYDVASGAGMLVGAIFAVAATTAKAGDAVEGDVVGCFDLPKAAGAVTQGAKLYWDNTARVVTTVATNNTLIGVATRAAANGDATANVRLNGAFS